MPRAKRADTLGGLTAADLKIKCPTDTFPTADVCVEKTPRAAASYGSAVLTCLAVGTPAGPGGGCRPTGSFARRWVRVQLAAGGELTSNVYPSGSSPGQLDVLYVTDQVGSVALTPDTGAGAKAYRCVADPLN